MTAYQKNGRSANTHSSAPPTPSVPSSSREEDTPTKPWWLCFNKLSYMMLKIKRCISECNVFPKNMIRISCLDPICAEKKGRWESPVIHGCRDWDTDCRKLNLSCKSKHKLRAPCWTHCKKQNLKHRGSDEAENIIIDSDLWISSWVAEVWCRSTANSYQWGVFGAYLTETNSPLYLHSTV